MHLKYVLAFWTEVLFLKKYCTNRMITDDYTFEIENELWDDTPFRQDNATSFRASSQKINFIL